MDTYNIRQEVDQLKSYLRFNRTQLAGRGALFLAALWTLSYGYQFKASLLQFREACEETKQEKTDTLARTGKKYLLELLTNNQSKREGGNYLEEVFRQQRL